MTKLHLFCGYNNIIKADHHGLLLLFPHIRIQVCKEFRRFFWFRCVVFKPLISGFYPVFLALLLQIGDICCIIIFVYAFYYIIYDSDG